MGYCEEFQLLIQKEDFANFLHLWEEYCQADEVLGEELYKVLKIIKNSPLAPTFGKYAETILPLWQLIKEERVKENVLRMALDLQTTNRSLFADLASDFLQKKYGSLKEYGDMFRLVGLRARTQFQGAISNFELLLHMKKGNFVFHTGGWGVGEIMEASLLRQHTLIEFEGISSLKDISFENAFKNLISLSSEHFLARRFGRPDELEKEGKEDPLSLIYLLLRDLGPKNATQIKEELCDLVIPEKDWTKWWQQTRGKIKKDTKIQSPENSRDPFALREQALSHDIHFKSALAKAKTTPSFIQTIYNYQRDFPEVFKNQTLQEEVFASLMERLKEEESHKERNIAFKLQLYFLLEDIFPQEFKKNRSGFSDLILSMENTEAILNVIEIAAFKKRFLIAIKEHRKDFQSLFFHLFFFASPNLLRDFLFKELLSLTGTIPLLKEKLADLLNRVTVYPETFFWYFQKIVTEEQLFKGGLPFGDATGKAQFLEAFFILVHYIEDKEEYRELVKKMHNFLSQKRYLVFRELIQGARAEYLQEVLLLASKCHTINKSELRTLRSLAEVVQPSIKDKLEQAPKDEGVIWTTSEGYRKIQERIQLIGTVETVDNAREIEAARALGDLRENSEYKFALERRRNLQAELTTLSTQLQRARILSREDISSTEVSVGSIVEIRDSQGKSLVYTLLGPFDADVDNHVLSFQSKFAKAMIGCTAGDHFTFQGERYTVQSIKSFL